MSLDTQPHSILETGTKVIQDACRDIPDGKHGAVVAHATNDGAQLAIVGRINNNWQVVGYLDKPYNGSLEYGAAVVFTW